VATVVGTQFRLTVGPDDTLLEVSAGKVRLDRLDQSQSVLVADNESGLASAGGLDHRAVEWPENTAGLAFGYDPFKRTEARFANPDKPGNMTLAEYDVLGSAAQNDFSGVLELSGGYLREDEGGKDLVTLCQPAEGFTLEIVFSPAKSQANSPARIVSLGGEAGTTNLVFSQEGDSLRFELATDGPMPQPLVIPLPAARPVHLTITYQNGELVAYTSGRVVAQSAEWQGGFWGWTPGPLVIGADSRGGASWHGMIEALAIYTRRLDAAEVARNMQHYRVLAGRP
jgi:hypothetical protein